MKDSCSDLKSAKKEFAEAISKLAREIGRYETAIHKDKDDVVRLDKDDIAKLHKIKHDLTRNFKIVADATKTTN